MKLILTISILLSCLCGKGQTITKEQYQKQLNRLTLKDTLPDHITALTVDTPIVFTLASPQWSDLPPQYYTPLNYSDPFAALQSQITALQARIDSLIEAMRPKAGNVIEGVTKFDSYAIVSGDSIPAHYEFPGRVSDYVNLPDDPTTGTLFSWGRNKGGVDGKGVIEFDKDSVLHPTHAAQRRMNKALNRWLRYDSVPTVTAYLIDTRSRTIAIDHRTNLPHVRPDHPVEGMLVEYKPKHFCYFDGGRWVILKEVK